MPARATLTAVVVAVIVMALIVELVRRRRLREEYSVLWLVTGSGMVVVAVWYDPLVVITESIGLTDPNVTLFFFGLIFLTVVNIYYSVKLSALTNQLQTLAQRLALHEAEDGRHATEVPAVGDDSVAGVRSDR